MPKRYRVGIDVGINSTGLAAIEIDDSDDSPYGAIPMKLLSTMSVIHDGGVDPDKAKSADSRKSCSGVARRARRLLKRRSQRLDALDKELTKCGFDCHRADVVVETIQPNNPYYAWEVRSIAAKRYLSNNVEREVAIVVAVRSIARHRGWRNPYSNFKELEGQYKHPSPFYRDFVMRLSEMSCRKGEKEIDLNSVDTSSEDRLTPAELLAFCDVLNPSHSFRRDANVSESNIPLGKLHQSDYYQELKKIFKVQRVAEDVQKSILPRIFEVANPSAIGAAAKMVAHDDLQPDRIRATKASPSFQEFRILSTLVNLSVRKNGQKLPLTDEQRKSAFDFLSNPVRQVRDRPTWHDLAEHLGLSRNDLAGVGGQTEDGEPISEKLPPIMDTTCLITNEANKNEDLQPLLRWWQSASREEQELFVELNGNSGIDEASLSPEEKQALAKVDKFLSQLKEDTLVAIEKLRFPSGRAAYSAYTMRMMNSYMLDDGMSLHEARKAAFGVDDNWRPKPNNLGTPIGHPAADRTIRIVSRWLRACTKKWGAPVSVNIEHVRDGFVSPKQKREYDRENDKRYKQNQTSRIEAEQALGKSAISHADLRKWQALQRQNCQCAYCGKKINFATAQMDHIVPRKGAGSTNDRENLVAVCEECNESKDNKLFSLWADSQQIEEAIERVKYWNMDSTFPNVRAFSEYKRDVVARLKKSEEDDPIDSRSIESVAWMARELASQIKGFMSEQGIDTLEGTRNDSPVHVYRGWITAEARRASGIEGRLPWFGDYHVKTRLDRRHHAVDAAVIAILRPGVAQVLAERDSMHRAFEDTGGFETQAWKGYCGDQTHRAAYLKWKNAQMESLCMLLDRAMKEDRVIVTTPIRLGHSRGKVHEDTIQKCVKVKLGYSMSATAIDKVASAAIWKALTSLPEYSREDGLPVNERRFIMVHGKRLGPTSQISVMCSDVKDIDKRTNAITMPVRDGYAIAGIAIHHARIYRRKTSRGYEYSMMRVVAADLAKNHGDLFTVKLPDSSLSMRFADENTKAALISKTAEYVGWLVVGDEIVINPSNSLFVPEGNNAINKFMRAFPNTRHFKITGFPARTKIKLEAMQLSDEGLPKLDDISDDKMRKQVMKRTYGYDDWSNSDLAAIQKVFGMKAGLLLSVDKLFGSGVYIVRRSALGYPRWNPSCNMPCSWSVESDSVC